MERNLQHLNQNTARQPAFTHKWCVIEPHRLHFNKSGAGANVDTVHRNWGQSMRTCQTLASGYLENAKGSLVKCESRPERLAWLGRSWKGK